MGEFTNIHKAQAYYLDHVSKSSGVGELIMSRDATIAICAAWQRAAPVSVHEAREVKEEQIARFVGFVEGRLGVSVPQWWERGLNRWENGLGLPGDELSRRVTRQLKAEINVDVTMSQDGDNLILWDVQSMRELTVPNPFKAWKGRGMDPPTWQYTSDNDSILILEIPFYGHGPQLPIACIDRKSRQLQWFQTVWITEILGRGSPQLAVVGCQGDYAFVFGSGQRPGTSYFGVWNVCDGSVVAWFLTSMSSWTTDRRLE
jgi:hypothetical protein